MNRYTRLLVVVATIGPVACVADTPISLDDTATHGAAYPPVRIGASRTSSGAHSADHERQLADLRRQTASFHDFDSAVQAGYSAQLTPCWEHRTLGAMGYHHGNPALLDGAVDLLQPESLMYEPGPGGRPRLVGMEYIVPIAAWKGVSPPTLLGQAFHRHSFLPIYKLHVWLWRNNPRGLFADWNPKVSCEHAAETEYFD